MGTSLHFSSYLGALNLFSRIKEPELQFLGRDRCKRVFWQHECRLFTILIFSAFSCDFANSAIVSLQDFLYWKDMKRLSNAIFNLEFCCWKLVLLKIVFIGLNHYLTYWISKNLSLPMTSFKFKVMKDITQPLNVIFIWRITKAILKIFSSIFYQSEFA